MNYRSLKAANQGLYLGSTLLALAACAYAIMDGERPAWQQWLAGGASLVTLIWGSYYALLRYQVDALGVSRHSFFMLRERILWEELEEASLEEQDTMGTARCAITLRAKDGRTLTLSSDLLSLDALEELAADMRRQGYLEHTEEDS